MELSGGWNYEKSHMVTEVETVQDSDFSQIQVIESESVVEVEKEGES